MNTEVVLIFEAAGLALTPEQVRAGRERYRQLVPDDTQLSSAAQSEPERWLTSQQLAALTGIGDVRLERMAARAEIPSIRVGRSLRFKLSAVEAALAERGARSTM